MTNTKKKTHLWLLVLSFLLVAMRFLSPRIVPFISDEPIFQEWAEQILQTGHWPAVCLGGSSIPISYGAGAVWLYTIPHYLFPGSLGFTLFHITQYSFGFLFLYLGLRRMLCPLSAAWALLLAASSPLLFLLSRHTWDTTFFVPSTGFILLCFSHLWIPSDEGPWHWSVKRFLPLLGISFACALCINIHLSIGPTVVAVYATLLAWLLKLEKKNMAAWLAVFLSGTLVLLLCTPYALAGYEFMHKYPTIMAQTHYSRWGSGRHFWWNILHVFVWISTWHINVFFEPIYDDFLQFIGFGAKSIFHLDLMGWIVKFPLILMLFWAPVSLLRKKWSKASLPLCYAAAGFFCVLLVFQYLNVPVQPHYFHCVWWLPFLAVAIFFYRLPERYKKYYAFFVALAVLTNIVFNVGTLAYITKNGGVRGMHISTGIGETEKAVEDLCEMSKAEHLNNLRIDISRIYLGYSPIKYFIKHTKKCEGLSAGVSMQPITDAHYRMEYIDAQGPNARFHAVRVK